MVRRGLVLLMLCGACRSEDKAPPAPPRPPASAPAGLDRLQVVLDGKPVAMAQAYIKRLALDGTYQIFVTSKSSSCAELLDNLFNRRDGEQTVLVNVGPRLAPDGKLPTVVTYFFRSDSVELAMGASASVDGDVTRKGAEVRVALDFAVTGPKGNLSVKGAFPAEACGVQRPDPNGVPKAAHPSTATVKVAGHELPLAGAIRKGKDLLLSTGVKDCGPFQPWAALVVQRQRGFWSLEGSWLEREVGNDHLPDEKTAKLEVVEGARGTGDDGPTIELGLSGQGTIGDYPIELSGTIQALDCPS